MSAKLSSSNRPLDTDGFNTDIRWTFVGRGGTKHTSYCRQKEIVRYGGISQMGKKKDRLRAEEFQKLVFDDARSFPFDIASCARLS